MISSDTSALEQQMSGNTIDKVNRWHCVTEAKYARPALPIKEHYGQLEQVLNQFP
jgi:hypothetical protein